MRRLQSPSGVTVSYDQYGSGPALMLIHGSFSDHRTNWEFVKDDLSQRYSVYAVARRGRGETDATEGHGVEDEFGDIVTVIDSIDEPLFMLGHSYGAHVALGAALMRPHKIRKLVIYEPIKPEVIDKQVLRQLQLLALENDWHQVAEVFFRDMLHVPEDVLKEMQTPQIWTPILEDAKASLNDVRAVANYDFDANRFSTLKMPVLLQVGSESPRELYATDAIAPVLPDARIEELAGQAHEGMTTAPALFVESVSQFLV